MKDEIVQIDSSLRLMFDQMPGCWGCKDNDSVFMYANKEYANIIGIKENRHLDIIGRTDFDMPCDTVNCADLFRIQDKAVITTGKTLKILDIHPFSGNDWRAYIFTKIPFYDSNQNIRGTIFHGADITSNKLLELGSLLSKVTCDVSSNLLSGLHSFLLSNEFNNIKLTDREAECLFFLLRGKTAKHIARVMSLSPRTVEEYIVKLKMKLGATNKCELIDKGIQAGFLNIIPERLMQTQLSVALSNE